jgi:hypothetical protein
MMRRGQTFAIKVSLPNMLIKCTLLSISHPAGGECAQYGEGGILLLFLKAEADTTRGLIKSPLSLFLK